MSIQKSWLPTLVLVGCWCLAGVGAHGQLPQAAVPVADGPETIAIGGVPYGVLSIEIPLPEDWVGLEVRVLVHEDSNRVYFPVVSPKVLEVTLPQETLPPPRIGRQGGLLYRLRQTFRSPPKKTRKAVAVRVDALFRGSENLKLQLVGDVQQRMEIEIQTGAEHHANLLDRWWKAYTEYAAHMVAQEGSIKGVHRYLVAMLAGRLGLPPVDLDAIASDAAKEESKLKALETLELILPTPDLKDEILAKVLSAPESMDGGEVAVPLGPNWQVPALPVIPNAEPPIEVESLASRVPPECFYLRFGSFANYVWFKELGERFGGEISNAFAAPSLDFGGSAAAERMLATRITTVSKMFGDKVIKDMALIGTDLYVGDGASMGVLFQASNSTLLKVSLDSDRKAFLSENADATLTDVDIAGRNVSLLSTPDNRIRSFMLVDREFILISTNRHLIERFIAVTEDQNSLSASSMFRWVRQRMPPSNDYSVFGYFPPEFFQNLIGPHYQIELRRRLRAAAHIQIAETASLLAKFDQTIRDINSPRGDPQDLIPMRDAQWLPAWFDVRADGTRLLWSGDRWVDSLRGGLGSFLPIADVKIQHVSAEEAAEYASIAKYYEKNWRSMDPLFFGLRRFRDDQSEGPNREVFSIEACLAPFEPTKYGWIFEQLAEPGTIAVNFPKDDMVSAQIRFQGEGENEPYYLFGGLKDMFPPEEEEVRGLIRSLRAFKEAPAYMGAWPKPDIIGSLPLGIGARLNDADVNGYSRMIGGLWRWQDEQWSILSFHKAILDSATKQVNLSETQESSQIRVNVADLKGSQLAAWVNQTAWRQAWGFSHNNARLLDAMNQQLGVPVDRCPSALERIVGGSVACALGGQFQLQPIQSDHSGRVPSERWWISSAWAKGGFDDRGRSLPPEGYQVPWLQWFRGAKVHATQQPGSLMLVGMVNTEFPETGDSLAGASAGKGPPDELAPTKGFNVFELPLKLFGENTNADDGAKANPDTRKPGTRIEF